VPTTRYILQFTDRYMAPNRNQLSGYDASEGALYILLMMVLAAHVHSPRILAIDNFDQALNPRTACRMSELFCDVALAEGRQVFLTTHNPLVLDGLPLSDPRVALFTVDRSTSDGASKVRRVDIDTIKTYKQKTDWVMSRLWLSGRLGGMPNV
jgi:predicted ATPase